jgi:hypothetical protein
MSTKQASTSAKILYRPVGLVTSVIAGLLAGLVFRTVWHKTAADDKSDPPRPLESEYQLREILTAAVLQGAIYAVVKAATERGGARAFERITGEWPGS